MSTIEAALEPFLLEAVRELIRSDDFESFRSWVAGEIHQLPAEMQGDDGNERSLATALALSLWRSTPHPGHRFRPAPLPDVGRNAPCLCGSGRKYKRCCLGPQLELETELLWTLVVQHLKPKELREAVAGGEIPLSAAGMAAWNLLDSGEPRQALDLLEPLFDQPPARLARLDERYDAALDALLDVYSELGEVDKMLEQLDRLEGALGPPLRARIYLRKSMMASDRNEHERALELIELARRDDPEQPALAMFEVIALQSAGELALAMERARFWVRKLEQRGYPPESELLGLLRGFAANPDRASILAGLPTAVDPKHVERFLDLLALHQGRPLPVYQIADGPDDGSDLELDVLVQPEAVFEVESYWQGVVELGDVELSDVELGDPELYDEPGLIDLWDPDEAGNWLAFLGEQPEAFDSLLILQQLLDSMLEFPAFGAPGFDREIVLPLTERAWAIVDRALSEESRAEESRADDSRPGSEVSLSPDDDTNTACINLLAARLGARERLGHDDEALATAERLLDLDPYDVHGVVALRVGSLFDAGRDEEALELTSQPSEQAAANPVTGYLRALALFRLGRLDEAAAAFDEVHRVLPTVVDYITGEKEVSLPAPSSTDPFPSLEEMLEAGSQTCSEHVAPYWRETPGALDWLRKAKRDFGRRVRERERQAPERRAERRSKARGKVCRLRVELMGIEPTIWRGIEMRYSGTFADLHKAIQRAMGWLDYHLHEFSVTDPDTGEPVRVGLPDPGGFYDEDLLRDSDARLSDYLTEETPALDYLYDFGDDWQHRVTLEGMRKSKKGERLPRLVDGARACPPEDCGGVYGYANLVKAMADREHPDREELLEWLGEPYDPERFAL